MSLKNTNEQDGSEEYGEAMLHETIAVFPIRNYYMSSDAADCICERKTVLINTEKLQRSEKRRVLDYLSGAIHVLGFSIEQVAEELYLVSPGGAFKSQEAVENDGECEFQMSMDSFGDEETNK